MIHQKDKLGYDVYVFPIKVCAPKIFARPACAKSKGIKFTQYESAKIKGKRKMPRMNEKWQIYSKIRVREN